MQRNRRRVRVAMVVGGLLIAVVVTLLVRTGLAKARVTVDARRLSAAGMVLHLYTSDHAGAYPDTLAAALQAESLDPSLAFCAASDQSTPDTRFPYVYLGRSLTTDAAGANTVVAYSPPAYFGGGGSNVLLGDGRTLWITAAQLPAVLARGGPATRRATAAVG